jgi:hypothetical protein
MLPLAQHTPVALEHPLVTPWARAAVTPTAEPYSLAASQSVTRSRPWQLKPEPPQAKVLLSSSDARQMAFKKRAAVRVAKANARALEKKIAGGGLETEEANALLGELDAARRASKPAPLPPRALRRASWRAARKDVRAQVFTMNQNEGTTYPATVASRAWRGLWEKAVAR